MQGRALRRLTVLLASTPLISTLWAPPAMATDLQFTGYARSRDDGRLLYVESHHVRNAGAVGETRIVMYRCSIDGPAFARKELTYGSVREEPEFSFTDARRGYLEGLRRTTQGPLVFQQENARAPRREAKVPANTVIVADAGFDEFVRKHWAELEAGKSVRFPFLIPSRLDYLSFKVKKHDEVKIDGATASVIRLNLSGVLGWFLPYIDVSYRKTDRVLMRYEGLTNIHGDNNGNLVAIIEFPLRERRTVPAVDLLKLRAETLVSRC
ncbi:MAG: hypothetical protein ACKO3O_04585 [Gammaproteobacteria bacterium]